MPSIVPHSPDTSQRGPPQTGPCAYAGTMENYPAGWEADVVLRDGGTAHLRPITPADADALSRMHEAQSPESVYLRFFAPLPRLPKRDLDRFVNVDHHDRVALIMLIGDDIIGVGRFDKISDTEAEVAFNIAEDRKSTRLNSSHVAISYAV